MTTPPQPQPFAIGTFTCEALQITYRARGATVPVGGVASWTVEHVISDGEGGPVLLRKTLATGVTLTNAGDPTTTPPTDATWTVTNSKAQNAAIAAQSNAPWHTFNRIDSGAEMVIARGAYRVTGEATGA